MTEFRAGRIQSSVFEPTSYRTLPPKHTQGMLGFELFTGGIPAELRAYATTKRTVEHSEHPLGDFWSQGVDVTSDRRFKVLEQEHGDIAGLIKGMLSRSLDERPKMQQALEACRGPALEENQRVVTGSRARGRARACARACACTHEHAHTHVRTHTRTHMRARTCAHARSRARATRHAPRATRHAHAHAHAGRATPDAHGLDRSADLWVRAAFFRRPRHPLAHMLLP